MARQRAKRTGAMDSPVDLAAWLRIDSGPGKKKQGEDEMHQNGARQGATYGGVHTEVVA